MQARAHQSLREHVIAMIAIRPELGVFRDELDRIQFDLEAAGLNLDATGKNHEFFHACVFVCIRVYFFVEILGSCVFVRIRVYS